jgi:hypothetical protein
MATKTRTARIADVREAMDALPRFIVLAIAAEDAAADPATDTGALAAWAEVELWGATVHRQARLLAGKTRGG